METATETLTVNEWETLGASDAPAWYLDRLVAQQKRSVHQELIRRWTAGRSLDRVWKTDLFEEANGADAILFDVLPSAAVTVGSDIAPSTVARASERSKNGRIRFCISDTRATAFRPGSVDLIISPSTLDHFDNRAEIDVALSELAGVLRPGGMLVITLDNPHNPLYYPLRWYSRLKIAPFRLGYSMSQRELSRALQRHGLEVVAEDLLLHNPRMISTAIFLAARRILGPGADGVIQFLLGAFAKLGSLPSRRFTACFIAACAVKPAAGMRPSASSSR